MIILSMICFITGFLLYGGFSLYAILHTVFVKHIMYDDTASRTKRLKAIDDEINFQIELKKGDALQKDYERYLLAGPAESGDIGYEPFARWAALDREDIIKEQKVEDIRPFINLSKQRRLK